MTLPSAAANPDGPREPIGLTAGERPFAGRIGTALHQAWSGGEDKLLKLVLAVSFCVHALVFVLHDLNLPSSRTKLIQEDWSSIDADLLPDLVSTAPLKTALPDAAPAPEAKVPEEMLPALTRKFEVVQPKKAEEEIADEKIEEEKKIAEDEAKRLEAEKKKEAELEIQKQKEEDNKLELADAQKRAALEKLRLLNKTATTMEAPEKDPLAAIKSELEKKTGKLNKGAQASNTLTGAAKQYGARLKAAIQQHYSIPEAYNLRGATLKVGLAIAVNDRGDLVELRVEETSGDPGFDAITMDAVRASVPLPPPPLDMAGQAILLMFTP